ncbi:MAG: bacilysin biosynthesis protein BacA [Stappia sp.]|nr:bacilysin biosynthesis protein BacA [Stappia sp.]
MTFDTAPADLAGIRRIRTLGPKGTNCEAAARHYARSHGLDAEIVLHATLEDAIELVIREPGSALLGCVVYPDLHQLVFPYLGRMTLADLFLFDTFNMVLAARSAETPLKRIASHPAPQSLVPPSAETLLVNSNSEAARLCRAGEVDGCITTLAAARQEGLEVLSDHGPVPMGFTIHVPRIATADAYAEAV